jgi:hypothetical protein
MTSRFSMTNDTRVFFAVRFDAQTGVMIRARDEKGTAEAIRRDGLEIDPTSESWCPHQWLNRRGYIDPALVRRHRYALRWGTKSI